MADRPLPGNREFPGGPPPYFGYRVLFHQSLYNDVFTVEYAMDTYEFRIRYYDYTSIISNMLILYNRN